MTTVYDQSRVSPLDWDGHILLLHGSESERRSGLAAWVRRGLENDEKVIYAEAGGIRPERSFMRILRDKGIDTAQAVSTPQDKPLFERLLGDGSDFGLRFSYLHQDQPRGLADAFIIGADFVGTGRVALVLGDNIFYGSGLQDMLTSAHALETGATVFGYPVKSPEQYGVIELDESGRAVSIEETATAEVEHSGDWTLFLRQRRASHCCRPKPSARGELEITDVNRAYMDRHDLFVEVLGRGFAWLDTGTHESLVEASHFVQILEQRQGLRVACPEEIALRLGYISLDHFEKLAARCAKSSYGQYLLGIHRSFAQSQNGAPTHAV